MTTSNFEHEVTLGASSASSSPSRTTRSPENKLGDACVIQNFAMVFLICIYIFYVTLASFVESEASTITSHVFGLHTIFFFTSTESNHNPPLSETKNPSSFSESIPSESISNREITLEQSSHSISRQPSSMCYLLPFAKGEKYGKFRQLLENSWLGDANILLYWILVDHENGPYYFASNQTIFVSMTQEEDYTTVKEKVANAFIYITENIEKFGDCLYFMKVDYDMYINTRLINYTFTRWPQEHTYFGQINPRFENTFKRMEGKHKHPPKDLDWWGTPMWTTFGFTRAFMPRVAKMFENHTTDSYPKWVVWDDQMAGYYMMKNNIPGYPMGLFKATNALKPKWKLPMHFNETEESCRKYAETIYTPCMLYYHALKWHRRCLYKHLHDLFKREDSIVIKQCLRRDVNDFTWIFPNLLSKRNATGDGTLGEFIGLLPEPE